MLNFKAKQGYPMVHEVTPIKNDHFTYVYTNTEPPEIGESVSTIMARDAIVISLDKIEPPKSRHHTDIVMKYTITCKILWPNKQQDE